MADLAVMPPRARAILMEVAALRGISPVKIGNPCRQAKVFRARVEVAKRLDACGYSSTQIGRMLRHDHTTVLLYLGKLCRQVSRPKWRKPTVKDLTAPSRPVALKDSVSYLRPYAGIDPAEYKFLQRRKDEESRT